MRKHKILVVIAMGRAHVLGNHFEKRTMWKACQLGCTYSVHLACMWHEIRHLDGWSLETECGRLGSVEGVKMKSEPRAGDSKRKCDQRSDRVWTSDKGGSSAGRKLQWIVPRRRWWKKSSNMQNPNPTLFARQWWWKNRAVKIICWPKMRNTGHLVC